MRKLIVLIAAGAAVAATAIAVIAGTEDVHLLDPAKLPPVVECLDENGDVAAVVLNPIFEVPGDQDAQTGC